MSRYRCIYLDSNIEWNEALKDIPHSFAHTRENCYSMSLTTGFNTFLFCYESEGVKIICPVAERKYKEHTDIVTPYGFSGFTGTGDDNEFVRYWNEFVTQKKYVCGYISINPAFQNNTYFNSEDSFTSTNLYFIDLKLSLTELFENLDANRKKQIKNYRKFEAGFIYNRKILTDFFINNYNDFLKRINASGANYFTKDTLEFICGQEKVFMAGAGSKEKIEAVFIFAHTAYIGDCLFNVATPEGREYTAPLLWCGLKFFRKNKIPLMNLGGGIKEDDNVALSKQRFGAYKLPFINLKQIYDRDTYNLLCKEKGINPDDRSGYFPAYRKD